MKCLASKWIKKSTISKNNSLTESRMHCLMLIQCPAALWWTWCGSNMSRLCRLLTAGFAWARRNYSEVDYFEKLWLRHCHFGSVHQNWSFLGELWLLRLRFTRHSRAPEFYPRAPGTDPSSPRCSALWRGLPLSRAGSRSEFFFSWHRFWEGWRRHHWWLYA